MQPKKSRLKLNRFRIVSIIMYFRKANKAKRKITGRMIQSTGVETGRQS